MDIKCQICGIDCLFFELEFVRPRCRHLLHETCLGEFDYYCMACQRYVEGVEPVTWNELTKFCKDCDKLQEIFANVVADIAASDKSNPIEWLHALTTTVTRFEYPSLLVKRIKEGIKSYKEKTESLYMKDEKNELVNFGIPIRYNDETTKTIDEVRRCIKELNKWLENELSISKFFQKWANDLQRIFPNLNFDIYVSHCVKRYKRKIDSWSAR